MTDRRDGVYAMVLRERMRPEARKLRDFYARVPDAPLFQKEFGYYCLQRWYEQGLDRNADLADLFGYDPPAHHALGELGWCEAGFAPKFAEKVIEDRGDYEVVRDFAGRHLLCFKGRRNGFMPEYLDHPVKDMRTWERDVKWRMDPSTPERMDGFAERMDAAKAAAAEGLWIQQWLVGGYMYLRSLIGPVDLLYAFCDQPELIHNCMAAWLVLADAVIARHQQHVTLDEIFLGEDICFNHGPLISPAMMAEFLLPYYQQLIANIRSRQLDPTRHLYVQIDTDGYPVPVIDLYREAIGMDVMSPFEVAAGNDVVRIGRDWPSVAISGGIDKRILAKGPDAIDRHVDAILPVMRARGGYLPTCDHGVPEEVSLANYLHYRRRCLEFS